MLEENDIIVSSLAVQFLSFRDMDEGYCMVNGIVKRLNDRGIEINIREVQRKAYQCEEEVK